MEEGEVMKSVTVCSGTQYSFLEWFSERTFACLGVTEASVHNGFQRLFGSAACSNKHFAWHVGSEAGSNPILKQAAAAILSVFKAPEQGKAAMLSVPVA